MSFVLLSCNRIKEDNKNGMIETPEKSEITSLSWESKFDSKSENDGVEKTFVPIHEEMLYLVLDSYIPPFKSQFMVIDFNLLISESQTEPTIISTDDEFLGHTPSLDWDSTFSKAVFFNHTGLHLFDSKNNTFLELPKIPFHHLPVYWNKNDSTIALTVDNGKYFSANVLLIDISTKNLKQIDLPENSFPFILGWLDNNNLLVCIDEFGTLDSTTKMEVINRKMSILNTETIKFTEIYQEKDWLATGFKLLSPDGEKLLITEFQTESNNLLHEKIKILNLHNGCVEEKNIEPGIIKWIDLENILVYTRGEADDKPKVTWYKNWHLEQSISFPDNFIITEALLSPDAEFLIVFLSGATRDFSGESIGYKIVIIDQEGNMKERLIPGFDQSDWVVNFASFSSLIN